MASFGALLLSRHFVFLRAEKTLRKTIVRGACTVKDSKTYTLVDFESVSRDTLFTRTRGAPHPALVIPAGRFLSSRALEFHVTIRPLIGRRVVGHRDRLDRSMGVGQAIAKVCRFARSLGVGHGGCRIYLRRQVRQWMVHRLKLTLGVPRGGPWNTPPTL